MTPSLVRRLRSGDAHAGQVLDDLYREPIYRLCCAYLDNVEEAEDAVQEVFCRVLRAEQVPDNFRAWLYRIARNYCLDVKRQWIQRGPKGTLPSESKLGEVLTGHLSRLLKQEEQARMMQVLATLPESEREILSLRYSAGMSRDQIAELLELTTSVVKSRLFEGLKKLRSGVI